MKKDSLKYQELYINLDDSGNFYNNEPVCIYGGLVFFSKAEKDKFITQYRAIINNIKCKYCKDDPDDCISACPEIKDTNIHSQDKRRIMNYIKKYFVIAVVIRNDQIYDNIFNSKAARGRYTDYAIRRLIKGLLNRLILYKSIDPYKPVRLIINIDQQSTKSNGYYNLTDSLIEELKYGIQNYNYDVQFPPILFDELNISLQYQVSKNSYVVQAADLIAGTIRRQALDILEKKQNLVQELSNYAQYVLILPK